MRIALPALLLFAGSVVNAGGMPAYGRQVQKPESGLHRVWEQPLRVNIRGPVYHFSKQIRDYAPGKGPWQVAIKYHGCPQTRRGALRFAILLLNGKPYTRTVVLRRTSDARLYEFWPPRPNEFYYSFVVPGARGCAAWTFVRTTS